MNRLRRPLLLAAAFLAAGWVLSGCSSPRGADRASPGGPRPRFAASAFPMVGAPGEGATLVTPGASSGGGGERSRSPSEATAYRLKAGDPITVYLRGILPRDDQIQDVIDERGFINLPYINAVLASGKTTSELESEIERKYVEGKIYKQVTVNVVMLSQGYFVRGEVKAPGRFDLISGTTLVQAVAAAGGYTEFADPRKVRLIRGGRTSDINVRDLEADPRKDISIEAGDVVVVPRSIW